MRNLINSGRVAASPGARKGGVAAEASPSSDIPGLKIETWGTRSDFEVEVFGITRKGRLDWAAKGEKFEASSRGIWSALPPKSKLVAESALAASGLTESVSAESVDAPPN
jgi:hypothetical protein